MTIYYSTTTRGFYHSDINPTMPGDAVEVSDVEYAALLNAQSSGQIIEPDEDGVPQAEDQPVAVLIAAAKARIRAGYDAQVAITKDHVSPMLVVDSDFWVLNAEAVAYNADAGATVPMMDAFNAENGMPKGEISFVVRQRAAQYAEDMGTWLGMLETKIGAIGALGGSPTQEQLDAIVWP